MSAGATDGRLFSLWNRHFKDGRQYRLTLMDGEVKQIILSVMVPGI
jgi:hypothetical protein